jgi:prepilin-type N-terminal cleavage/methylation domain-containing protein
MVTGERGFTLVELIIAVTVFTIGVLGTLGVTAGITRLIGQGDRTATASFYAQERLEAVRTNLDCTTLTSGSETRGGIYDVRWEVTSMFDGNARRVQIYVSYPSRPGITRVDTLGTSVSCVL